MKQNKYDDESFFKQYSNMQRSVEGLEGAGEWHVLRRMFPDFKDKRVLDLGCGFGWHCRYAAEHGAQSVAGIDISEKMLKQAREYTKSSQIEYRKIAIEDVDYPEESYDVVISSLAFHYVKSFDDICKKVNELLVSDGDFVFSVEHPVYTSCENQNWHYDNNGNIMHWPVDHYFEEGLRKTEFLGSEVMKYHRTLTTYVTTLLKNGFQITDVQEPEPEEKFLKVSDDMRQEVRRPMFLIISAKKI